MFLSVLENVGVMFAYALIGFVLCKAKLLEEKGGKALSAILVYALAPCMILSSFLEMEYSGDTLKDIGLFFAATFLLQLAFFGILFLIFRKKFADAKYRMLTVGSVLGNVGYFGLPLIKGIFPDNPIVACYSCVYVLSMNLLIFTVGSFLITNDRKYISIKGALLNPTTIAVAVSLPLFIFHVDFPSWIDAPISLLGKMVTPVCMITIGMRLASSSLKGLFTRPFVYWTCLIKLIVFPLFAYLCVVFIPGLSQAFKVAILVLSACPSGAIISSLAELYGKEQELSANIVIFSTFACVATLPLLLLLV